jgi:conjugative transfer signal peptidase TraF
MNAHKCFTILFLAAIALLSGLGLAYGSGIRINTTHSIPLGMYKLVKQPATKGAYVIFCPPVNPLFNEAFKRGYFPAGFCPGNYGRMMKIIMAEGGDKITISGDGVYVNGELLPHSKPFEQDSLGRVLPQFTIVNHFLRKGDLLLMTNTIDNSFDSRYFGVLPREQIESVIVPVIQW